MKLNKIQIGLVLLTLAGFGRWWWSMQRYDFSFSELRELQVKLGDLEIEDEEKVHVLAIADQEEDVFAWQVWTPNTYSHGLSIYETTLGKDGQPKLDWEAVIDESYLGAGFRSRNVVYARTLADEGTVTLEVDGFGEFDDFSHLTIDRSQEEMDIFTLGPGTEAFEQDEPIVLMSLVEKSQTGGNVESSERRGLFLVVVPQ